MGRSRFSHPRAGASMVELLVALSLLGLLLTLTVPLLQRVNSSRQATEQHRIAALELSNLMEELATRSAARLTQEELQKLTLSETAKHALPEATLKATAQADPDLKDLVQITLRISWPSLTGRHVAPIQLVAWLGGSSS